LKHLQNGPALPLGGREIRPRGMVESIDYVPEALQRRARRQELGFLAKPARLVISAGDPRDFGPLQRERAGRTVLPERRFGKSIEPGRTLQLLGPDRGVCSRLGLPALCPRIEQEHMADIMAEPAAFFGRKQSDRWPIHPGWVVQNAVTSEDPAA